MSMNGYDAFLLRQYLLHALRRAQGDRELRSALPDWLRGERDRFRIWRAPFLAEGLKKVVKAGKGRRGYLARVVPLLAKSLDPVPARNSEARAASLAVRRFRLDETCESLLGLARLYQACDYRRFDSDVAGLWNAVHGVVDPVETSAVLLAIPRRRIESALHQLIRAGCAYPEAWEADSDPGAYDANWLRDAMYAPPVSSAEELEERLVPLATVAKHSMDDFAHVEERGLASRLLAGAVESGAAVRILFHGRPGAGKTEFAKTLTAAVGGRLRDLGGDRRRRGWRRERKDRKDRRSVRNRNRLRMAQAILRGEPGAVLLCDEVEDVLSSKGGARRENHQLLEECVVPVIFTGNRLKKFDEAILRRFDLIVRFKAHNPTRRRRLVRRMLENSGLAAGRGEAGRRLAERLADELECPPAIIERAIASARLAGGGAEDLFAFATHLERAVSTHIRRPRLGPPVRPGLAWEAFAHLGEPAEDFRILLSEAIRARKQGNAGAATTFLAYGRPGCGKTEFCRTVAAEAGAVLYSIGDQELGLEPRLSVSRRDALEYALEALADEPGAVILFDELEDFCFGRSAPPKHWMNRLVEHAPVPLLFTANAIRALRRWEPHFLERMTYSMEFPRLPRSRRRALFADLLDENQRGLTDALAADGKATPRQARNAAFVGRVTGRGVSAAARALAQKRALLRGSGTAPLRRASGYEVSLARADCDLAALTERIVGIGPVRAGLLLDGPPGSGKSEYAKHLADGLDIEPVPKRASDLMSKWVGETEQQIAGAFAEARATGGMLIIDEADSFLADRRGARRNWEISQVNEMLSQLETHDLPYAFTTNLGHRLDPAVARRFLFQVTFRYLDEGRIARNWEFFFAGDCPPDLLRLTRAVPADFARVRERAAVLGFAEDLARCAEELRSDVRKKEGSVRAVGFRRRAA